MEMPFLRAGALAAAVLATANCATLYVNGTTQRIEVTSTPPGAEVFLDGEPVGTTPAEVVVSRRNRDRVIHIEKEGSGGTGGSSDAERAGGSCRTPRPESPWAWRPESGWAARAA